MSRYRRQLVQVNESTKPSAAPVFAAGAAKTIALERLKRLRLSIRLTASTETLDAFGDVMDRATTIRDEAMGGAALLPTRESLLDDAETKLFTAVKKDLRIKD